LKKIVEKNDPTNENKRRSDISNIEEDLNNPTKKQKQESQTKLLNMNVDEFLSKLNYQS